MRVDLDKLEALAERIERRRTKVCGKGTWWQSYPHHDGFGLNCEKHHDHYVGNMGEDEAEFVCVLSPKNVGVLVREVRELRGIAEAARELLESFDGEGLGYGALDDLVSRLAQYDAGGAP